MTSSGQSDSEPITVDISDDVADWINQEAEKYDISDDEFIFRVLETYKTIIGDKKKDLVSQSEIATLQNEFTDLLEDLRNRIIQVKLECDEKAPINHDHDYSHFEQQFNELNEDLEGLRQEIESNINNYETSIKELKTHDERLHLVAHSILDLQDRLNQRKRVDEIITEAHKLGSDSGKCDYCGETILFNLLREPSCPHCERSFTDVVDNRKFWGIRGTVILVGEKTEK